MRHYIYKVNPETPFIYRLGQACCDFFDGFVAIVSLGYLGSNSGFYFACYTYRKLNK